MITLSSHTSNALQPLDVSCFKPFKIAFRKVRDATMFRSNHMEPDKIILIGWVDQALEQSLTKKHIKFGFRTIGLWPLNPKAMDNKTRPFGSSHCNKLKALEQSLTKKNIRSGFRTTGLWPLNPKAMDNKTRSLEVYTAINLNNMQGMNRNTQ